MEELTIRFLVKPTFDWMVSLILLLGALYPDRTSGHHKADDAVPPGGNHTYTWTVPEDHGPTADDPACLTWIYHSHVNAPKDIASGLVGPLLICKQGKFTLKNRIGFVPSF